MKNVPKLRFKADDGSEFPEWEETKIDNIFMIIAKKNKDGLNKNVITNSAEYGLIPQRDFFDKDIAIDGNTNNYTVIEQGDFVYNPRKSKTAPFGPFNCYELNESGIVSPLYTCLRPVNAKNSSYLLRYFQSTAWHSYIRKNGAQGGARHDRVGMTSELMKNIPVRIPCFEEQQKIADFLSTIDEIIAKSRAEVEAWEERKKGVMQKIFSQEVRFKADDGSEFPEWEEKRFGNTVLIERGGSPRPIEQYITNDKNGFNWIKIGDAPQYGNHITHTAQKIIPEGLKKTRMVYAGDLILSNSMSFGKPYVLDIDGCIHDGWLLIRDEDNNYDKMFLCYLLGSEHMLKQYTKIAAGTGVNNLNKDVVYNTTVVVPSIPEQQKIADCLSSIDDVIKKCKKELVAWETFKKGLLQQMFV